MKVSTKGRYALRLMLDIATDTSGEPVKIKDVATRQEISEKYLEQIIAVLNKAGYVRSVRGAQGGYLLVKKPEEYTVGMILRLTEGSMAPVECLEYDTNICHRQDRCVTLILWEKINDAVKNVIDTITLADMIEWQQEKLDNYSI